MHDLVEGVNVEFQSRVRLVIVASEGEMTEMKKISRPPGEKRCEGLEIRDHFRLFWLVSVLLPLPLPLVPYVAGLEIRFWLEMRHPRVVARGMIHRKHASSEEVRYSATSCAEGLKYGKDVIQWKPPFNGNNTQIRYTRSVRENDSDLSAKVSVRRWGII